MEHMAKCAKFHGEMSPAVATFKSRRNATEQVHLTCRDLLKVHRRRPSCSMPSNFKGFNTGMIFCPGLSHSFVACASVKVLYELCSGAVKPGEAGSSPLGSVQRFCCGWVGVQCGGAHRRQAATTRASNTVVAGCTPLHNGVSAVLASYHSLVA